MHYCCLVFTNEFPTDEVIAEKMKPFNEEDFYSSHGDDETFSTKDYPTFLWDWYQVGGRYCARIKMKRDESREDYQWGYYAKTPRYNRLYRSKLIEDLASDTKKLGKSWRFAEEDVLPYCYDEDTNSYRVDGAETSLVVNRNDLYGFNMVRCDGSAETRSWYNGEGFVENPNYELQVDEEFKKAKYVCIVDIHS